VLDVNDYTFWRDALLKRQNGVEIQVPVDKPSCGFFQYRPHGKTGYQPVAIWRKDGLRCRVGSESVDPLKVWNYCAARPITEAEYKDGLANGFPAPVGDNQPPAEDFAAFDLQAQDLLQAARDWIKTLSAGENKVVQTQEQADAGAVLVDKLRKVKGDGDKRRLELTKPFREAEAEINGKWQPHLKAMDTAIKTLLARMSVFLTAQKAKAAVVEAETGMKVEPPKLGGGMTRRAITPRQDFEVEVTSPEQAAAHYGQRPEILELVIRFAKEEFKATRKNPPGCNVKEVEKAQ
jgi:hypothetical protein